jgi:hypothetical protein
VDPAKEQSIVAPKLRKNLDELRQQGVAIGKSHDFGHTAHTPGSGKLIEQGFKHAAFRAKQVVYGLPGHPGFPGQKIERETLKPARFKMRSSGRQNSGAFAVRPLQPFPERVGSFATGTFLGHGADINRSNLTLQIVKLNLG